MRDDMPEGTRVCGRCNGATLIYNAKVTRDRFITCPTCNGSGVVVAWGILDEKLEELLNE